MSVDLIVFPLDSELLEGRDSNICAAGTHVARKERPEKKQTVYVLTMRWGKGWQSREIRRKELKHEGHIALGK
jgi:allantoicase